MPKTPHIKSTLPGLPELRERHAEDLVAADLADPADADVDAERVDLDLAGRQATIAWPPPFAEERRGIVGQVEPRADPGVERRLGERDREAALGDVVDEREQRGAASTTIADERRLAPRGRARAGEPETMP